MNKKAILKEVAKTQTIKNLLNEGYSPSLLHKLIVEEFLKESSEKKKFPEINPFRPGDRKKYVADKFYNDPNNAVKYVKDFDKEPGDYSDEDKAAVRTVQQKLIVHTRENPEDDKAKQMLNALNRIQPVELSDDELKTAEKAINKLKQQAIKQLFEKVGTERDSKKKAQEVIKIVAALDGNPGSVSKEDVDSYKNTEISKLDGMSFKDILDALRDEQDSSANRDDLMEADDSLNLLNRFVATVKDQAGFELDLSQLDQEESKSLLKYLSFGRNLESTVEEFKSLLSSKIPDIEPAAQDAMNVEFDPDDEDYKIDDFSLIKQITYRAEEWNKFTIIHEKIVPIEQRKQIKSRVNTIEDNKEFGPEGGIKIKNVDNQDNSFIVQIGIPKYKNSFYEFIQNEFVKIYSQDNGVYSKVISEPSEGNPDNLPLEKIIAQLPERPESQEDPETETEEKPEGTPTVDPDTTVIKSDVSAVYEGEPESAISSFLDDFLQTRLFKDQVKLFTTLNQELDNLKNNLQDPEKVKRPSLNESLIKESVDKEKQIKEAEKLVLNKLKNLKSILTSLEGGDTTVVGQMQKMQIIKIAQEIQAGLKQLFDAFKLPNPTTLPESLTEATEPVKFKTRQEKIQYVKQTYNKLEPKLIKLDDTLTSFEDEEGATVELGPIISLIDDAKTELNKLSIFFDQSNTYFTKNKISIKKLNKRFKQLVRAYISIVKRLNAAEDPTDQAQVLEQIQKISKLVQKYLGAPSNLDGVSTEPVADPTSQQQPTVAPQVQRAISTAIDQEQQGGNAVPDPQTIAQNSNVEAAANDTDTSDEEVMQNVEQQLQDQGEQSQEDEEQEQQTDVTDNLRSEVKSLLDNEPDEVIDLITEYLKFLQGDDNLSESIIYENKDTKFDRKKYKNSVDAFIKKKKKKNELSQNLTNKQILDKLELMFKKDSDKFNQLFSLESRNKKIALDKLRVWASKKVNQEELVNPRIDEEGSPLFLQDILKKGYEVLGINYYRSKNRTDELDMEILKVVYEAIENGPFKEDFKIYSNIEIEFAKEIEKAFKNKNNWGRLQGLKKSGEIADELYDIIDPIYKARQERFDYEMENDTFKAVFSSGVFGMMGIIIGSVAVGPGAPIAASALGAVMGMYGGAVGGSLLFPKVITALSDKLGYTLSGTKQFDEEAIKTKGIVKAFLDAITPNENDEQELRNTKKSLEGVLYIKQAMLAMLTYLPKKTEGKEQYLQALREVGSFFENDVLYTAKKDLDQDLDAADILNLFYSEEMDEEEINKKLTEIEEKIKDIEQKKPKKEPTSKLPEVEVGFKYKYIDDWKNWNNNLSPNNEYEIEEIDGSKVKFKNHTRTGRDGTKEVGFIPWDQIKDKMQKIEEPQDVQEQIERKLEVIIERFINQRKQQWRKRTM